MRVCVGMFVWMHVLSQSELQHVVDTYTWCACSYYVLVFFQLLFLVFSFNSFSVGQVVAVLLNFVLIIASYFGNWWALFMH